MAKLELTRIIKTPSYKPGRTYVAKIVGKEKRAEFDKGKPIEVTREQLDLLKPTGWCLIWREKDGE